MITTHAVLYAEAPEEARAFLRDVLDLQHVDAGDGWLVLALPPSEIGVHPAGLPAAPSERHELYLLCDDIDATMRELAAKGVELTSPVSDAGWGLLSTLRIPGGADIGLYEPRHPTAHRS